MYRLRYFGAKKSLTVPILAIGPENRYKSSAEAIISAGCNMLVAGSSVFKSKDPLATIQQLKAISMDTIFN